MDDVTFNQDIIEENLLLEWVIDFEKSGVSRKIKRNVSETQEILDQLGQSDVLGKELKIWTYKRNRR